MLGWEIASNGSDGFGVYPGSAAYHVQIVFICEIKEENVVCLAVDAFSYGVRLVCYERGEYAEVAHACDYVIPVCFAEVKVRFFSEQEGSSYLPSLQGVYEFS